MSMSEGRVAGVVVVPNAGRQRENSLPDAGDSAAGCTSSLGGLAEFAPTIPWADHLS